MTPYTETQQLTIARAIAYVLERHTGEPGWATCSATSVAARGVPDGTRCGFQAGHAGHHQSIELARWWNPEHDARPLTTLADARAAWVASGGDPDRGPVLRWLSRDGHTSWATDADVIRVRVDHLAWRRRTESPLIVTAHAGPVVPARLRLVADIIEAVEGAMPEVTRG